MKTEPSIEDQISRLQVVVAKLATELDERWEYMHSHNQQQVLSVKERPSVEEMVEEILYSENF